MKTLGFENLVITPATQSWNGIVGTQQIAPWIELETTWKCDDEIEPYEVEAYMQDAAEVGDYDAMLCDWENYNGHLLWKSLHVIARFGNFVNDKPLDDESISAALFGRKTPYMECMHTLMNAQSLYFKECRKLPGCILTHQHEVDAVFAPLFMSKILRCGNRMFDDMAEILFQAAIKVKNLLKTWDAETDIEERCKKSLTFAVCYAQATAAILNLAHKAQKCYSEASLAQSIDTEEYAKLLQQVQKDYLEVSQRYDNWKQTLENTIADTGHTKQDIARLEKMKNMLCSFVQTLWHFETTGANYLNHISLPAWDRVVCDIFGEIDLSN